MAHMIDSMAFHPGCGGTLHTGGNGDTAHTTCSRCHAFRYDSDSDEEFPTGTDVAANQAAWDAGEERSPDAVTWYLQTFSYGRPVVASTLDEALTHEGCGGATHAQSPDGRYLVRRGDDWVEVTEAAYWRSLRARSASQQESRPGADE